MKGAQTRQAVLEAAIERFGREGFRATSVADIARDADVGGTVPYAYFPGKEALFFAAVDEDAAAVIQEGVTHLISGEQRNQWRDDLLLTLVAAVDRHPLARRLLAGLEPDITERVLEIPALAELRKAVATSLSEEQLAGLVRKDIDPIVMANGMVAIILSLLMSIVQLGVGSVEAYGFDVLAVFEAALEPPERRR